MGSSFAKRVMNKRPERARAVDRALSEAEAARSHQSSHEQQLEANRQRLHQTQIHKAALDDNLIEYLALSKELDKIDETLFDGPTLEYLEDDEAEWNVKLWQQVQLLMAAEFLREKRAGQHLKEAAPSLASTIKDIQNALQYCIDVGVATNTKYTKQLMTTSSPQATVRGTQSLILNAKTNSGRFFTTVAKARGSQPLVGKPPEFGLIELYLMPGSRNPKAVDERGLHRSLESSYAQAKIMDVYLKREISASLERRKKIASERVLAEQKLKQAKIACRRVRRCIVDHVIRAHASSPDLPPVSPTLNREKLQLTNPMVSATCQTDLRKAALAKLREMIALPEPDSDNDNV
jgi:hypothetical protein